VIAELKTRQHNIPLLDRVMAMIPEGASLILSVEGVKKGVILRNGTLSNEGDSIRIVRPILIDSVPVLNRIR
jgi:hypothetical protein